MPTEKRKSLWMGFNQWLEELKSTLGYGPLRIWVIGSFVTQKREPGDIDVVIFMPFEKRLALDIRLQKHINPVSKDINSVDAFVVEEFPKDHPSYPIYLSDQAEWADDFGTDRRSRLSVKPKKGFLEINC
jgi:hypothetical protein